MVLLGILNSRVGIGIETFINNLIYGPLAYFFLTLSGLIVIKMLQISNRETPNNRLNLRQGIILFGATFLIGFILAIINTVTNIVIYYFNILIILFYVIIGVLWLSLGYLASKRENITVVVNIAIISLTFSMGLIYGAILNTLTFPLYVYFFFFTASFLQPARELTKILGKEDRKKSSIVFARNYNRVNILKYSLFFQLAAIFFLILPIFTPLAYPILFLFLMVLGLIVIGIASILTLNSILGKMEFRKISSILKIGILIELITFLMLGS